MDDPRLSRKLIAYHEAAHAVVARKLGCPVERVDIAATAAGGGQCVHSTAVSPQRSPHGDPRFARQDEVAE